MAQPASTASYLQAMSNWFGRAAHAAVGMLTPVQFVPLRADAAFVPRRDVEIGDMPAMNKFRAPLIVELAVHALGHRIASVHQIRHSPAYGVITTSGARLAVTMVDDATVRSAAYPKLASDAGFGPAFHGAFTVVSVGAPESCMVTDWYPMNLHDALQVATADQQGALAERLDAVLLAMATYGFVCRNVKPMNFVAQLTPTVDVRAVDVGDHSCAWTEHPSTENMTTAYLAMKAAVELIARRHLGDYLHGRSLFGPEFETSGLLALGASYLQTYGTFVDASDVSTAELPRGGSSMRARTVQRIRQNSAAYSLKPVRFQPLRPWKT